MSKPLEPPKTTMVYCSPCMRHWKAPANEDYWNARVELCPKHQTEERLRRMGVQLPKWAREFAEQEEVRRAQADYDRPLSVTESYNLQEALKSIISRYGLNEVKEAIRLLEITSI